MGLIIFDLWSVDRRYLNDDSYISKKEAELKPTKDDNLIDQYANPDMAATESVIPKGSPIESVAEAAKVIYEITVHPE